jgi:uncharacterized protein YbbC (DUF1343 family)/CubicO group peptidase (beta-lactamase class C family)
VKPRRLLAFAIAIALAAQAASGSAGADSNVRRTLATQVFEPIAGVVNDEIRAGHVPGAVVLIGNQGKIVYRRAFGYRMLTPERVQMSSDTIFDLASLTKVVATTTAVMQLVESGRPRLNDPIASYWPNFGTNGKQDITIREALTHYSGLRPDLSAETRLHGYRSAIRRIATERPEFAPDTHYVYSDINFEILGELVRRVSGEPLDVYCRRHIFGPLGMKDTIFNPPRDERYRIAPTEYLGGELRWGKVHDPTAFAMGGVAGHAGLFSTADDLAIFAQMLLDGGIHNGVRILRQASVDEMLAPGSPPDGARARGLGWDLAAPLASNRDSLPPVGSAGHTGFTGTMIWLDPVSHTYVIVLTSRLYPDGHGDAKPLRDKILTLVSNALGPVTADEVVARRPSLAPYYKTGTAVLTGADVLEDEDLAPLKKLRVGLITNQTGVDSRGNRLVDVMRSAPDVKLRAIFTPEHGLFGNVDEKVLSGTDPVTGLPIFSLYGDVLRPTRPMLDGIDALVFDIQDAGARFYTYASTMAYAMEAARAQGIDFYVLDRPNPIDAGIVQGPVMDRDMKSFTGYFPMPTRHGMTLGELAEMFNAENRLGVRLHVVRMRGYRRDEWYDQTGLRWIAPSPNLRTLDEATLYPGVAMVEGTNVSVGRGTGTPFEVIGAPWLDGRRLAAYLNDREIPGVRFAATDFTPADGPYKEQRCYGTRIITLRREALDSPELGIEIASALHELASKNFRLDGALSLIGSHQALHAITDGVDPRQIARLWQPSLGEFRQERRKYLLY